MSIVLYGGGFNPPHLGHLSAADCAWEQLRPQRFLVVPDGTPPHKPLPKTTPDADTRFALCRLAFASRPWAELWDLALRREGPCYMIDTVRELQQQIADEEWYLLLGADMLLSFRQWYNYRYILSECTLAVAERENGEADDLEKAADVLRREDHARIIRLIYKPYPASSTDIREDLASGKCPVGLDAEVYRYIRENRLYFAG